MSQFPDSKATSNRAALRTQRDPERTRTIGERVRRLSAAVVALSFVALLSLVIVGFYAGLLRAGRWQIDEYQLFFNENRYGLRILPSRLIYSPRSFSETLIFLYGKAIEHVHRPLVGAFLASLWSCFW